MQTCVCTHACVPVHVHTCSQKILKKLKMEVIIYKKRTSKFLKIAQTKQYSQKIPLILLSLFCVISCWAWSLP